MKLNRRQLIGGAAVMTAMPGIPSAFATVKEETRDLVIVGGGLGGLSAANAAVNKGYKALVIEKLPFLGGAGIMPEGSLGINTKYQKAHGIKTTAQQVLDAALQFHHFRADPAVLRVLIEESTRTIDEIIDMGVELRGIRTMYPKEESLMCWHLVNPLRPIINWTGLPCLLPARTAWAQIASKLRNLRSHGTQLRANPN